MDYLKKHWGNLLLVGAVIAYFSLSLGTQNCPMCVAGDFLGFGSPSKPDAPQIHIGSKPANEWRVALLNGEQVESSKLEGRVTVLAYWATWCGPCVKEIPDLVQLRNEFPESQVEIIGISVDAANTDIERFASRYGVNYKIGRENESLYKAFGMVRSIPTIFIIDREGQIQHRHVGKMPHNVLQAQIAQLIEPKNLVSGL